ncbi:PTS system mannose/fructose/N-acetylgalactosamine-transporter subunit IIB [Lacticaseibacillus porcinae]|uniref:PTS system mannose/fructose/N-acetylgalactosamine-transporter subunit IIB n=1 Tax=Lacticaseibacillus porcinae TaxID=1123687 RepID=UPI000F789B62|nr:PTS sugar transporter subunit IIB [Lacticaseibacillus porcinae]
MAIIHARVDQRLIHGQVATVWSRLTKADRIAVINDDAVHDDMQIAALKLARPTGVKLVIMSIRRALISLTNGKYDDERVFLLTQSIQDMRALIDGGIKVDALNIGNIANHDGAKAIKPSVYLNAQDIEDIKAIKAHGVKVTAQMVPTESDADIETLIK